jgi:hypothetical protein
MRTLNAIIIILFTTTVLMVGLIETFNAFKENSRTDDMRNISMNPKDYLNKSITLIGNVYQPMILFDYRDNGIKYAISQDNEQGFYYMNLNSYKGDWIEPGTYRVKGIVSYVDVCICDYRCVDYIGNCVYIYDNLYSPNLTLSGFKTNLTSNDIKDDWYPNYDSYSRIIDYLCTVSRKDYFECSYERKNTFDAFNLQWQSVKGIFYKEYRCRLGSIERVYYVDATEPMVRI